MVLLMKNDFKMDMRDIKILQNSFHNIIKRTNELNKEWMKKMNKEQKIQELTERIKNSQAEIDELKEELDKLQKKPYEISYPIGYKLMWYLDDYASVTSYQYNNTTVDRVFYESGLLFDTKEEAEQFKRERALIKKIKCWAKEQQGDWQPDSDEDTAKYDIYYSGIEKKLKIFAAYTVTEFKKLPYFKTEEIAQACIDGFGDEILEVFY